MTPDTSGFLDSRRESEAIVNARNRLSFVERTQGKRHPDYPTALNQLALLLIMQGEPDSAEPLLREALEVRFAVLGPEHPDYATNLSSLGGLLWARGDLDEAEPLLRQAAEIRCTSLGRSHPKSMVSLNSLEQLVKARRETSADQATPPDMVSPSEEPRPADTDLGLPTVSIPGVSPSATPRRSFPVPRPMPPADTVPTVLPIFASRKAEATTPKPEALPEHLGVVEDGLPFVQKMDRLSTDFQDLAQRMTGAARDASTVGALPSDDLLARWREARERFQNLGSAIQLAAKDLDISLAAEATSSLDSIRGLIPEFQAATSRRQLRNSLKARASVVLDQVERLTCPSDAAFAPLLTCQERVRTLRASLDAGQEVPDEVHALAEGRHAFHALLNLVSADDAMNDTTWAEHFATVESNLGSPLAVAAARSKLIASTP